MKKILIAFIQLILAVVLTLLLAPSFVIVHIVSSIHFYFSKDSRRASAEEAVSYKKRVAVVVDKSWNVIYGPFFNWMFADSNLYKFGLDIDTVSQASGFNLLHGNSNKCFLRFSSLIDWFFLKVFKEKDHCLNSIKNRI